MTLDLLASLNQSRFLLVKSIRADAAYEKKVFWH